MSPCPPALPQAPRSPQPGSWGPWGLVPLTWAQGHSPSDRGSRDVSADRHPHPLLNQCVPPPPRKPSLEDYGGEGRAKGLTARPFHCVCLSDAPRSQGMRVCMPVCVPVCMHGHRCLGVRAYVWVCALPSREISVGREEKKPPRESGHVFLLNALSTPTFPALKCPVAASLCPRPPF